MFESNQFAGLESEINTVMDNREEVSFATKNEAYKEGVAKLLSNVINPSEEFTPIPFWFFNDEPDQDEIERQLTEYVEKGVNAIVLHPRIGIPKKITYLSEEFFDVVRFIVKNAARLNMKIVLYDEGMYPSGSAHGKVVDANPDFASKGISLAEQGEDKDVLAKLLNGKFLIRGFTGGNIRGIHFGEDDGEEGAPLSADILNPKAVKEFIRLTHDRYYEELKEFFGSTIIGFFTDEPCALGRNAGDFREWADGMEQEIKDNGGSLEELEGLFTGNENRTTAIYHRLIKKHLREIFYAPLSKWCKEHNIALMGHPAESDDVEEQLYFHIPGQDLIMRRIVPKTGGIFEPDSVQAKLSADIARHLGRRRNSNECFGVCYRDNIPWYFTGEDMKWYIDWLGMRGVNLFIPHAFYYSVRGERKGERPPDVGPNNIWWENYRRFSDYMKRLSFLMTDSVNGANVAVLCDNNKVPCEEVAALYEHQIEFNYLPVALLPDCTIEEGQLCIQGYRYDVVMNVLGDEIDSSLPGVCVVHSCSEIFDKECSGMSKIKRAVRTKQPDKTLRATHLIKYNTNMYLLSNEGTETIHTQICVPCKNIILVDLWNGIYKNPEAEYAGEETRINITLKPCETMLLISGEADKGNDVFIEKTVKKNWNDKFILVKKADNRAVYEYSYEAATQKESKVFEVTGEEMAECYCNGVPAGVSFWNPHRFDIGKFLQAGENKIELILTGNAANIYSNAEIFYGLTKQV